MANTLKQSSEGIGLGANGVTSKLTTGHFNSNTTPGNLLVLVISGMSYTATGSPTPTPTVVLGAPNTPGFTWTPITSATQTLSVEIGGASYYTESVAIYRIENAPSMGSGVNTTFTVSAGVSSTQAITGVVALMEIAGGSFSLDFSGEAVGVGGNPTVGTATTSQTEVLILAGWAGGGGINGAHGWTLGAYTGDYYSYLKLNAAPGSNPMTFGSVAFTGAGWAAVGASFKTAPPTPTITSVVLNSGPSGGGQLCTITGTNFNSDATVSFGGNLATNVVVISSTEITCVTPVHFPGTVDVKVTEAAGSVTATNAYTYTASKVPLTMNFQDAGGNPLSYGNVTFTLNTDAVTITGQQINAGRVVSFTLDVNGNLFGPLWPTDQMTSDSISPNTTYRVKAYTAEGQLCFEQDMVIST